MATVCENTMIHTCAAEEDRLLMRLRMLLPRSFCSCRSQRSNVTSYTGLIDSSRQCLCMHRKKALNLLLQIQLSLDAADRVKHKRVDSTAAAGELEAQSKKEKS